MAAACANGICLFYGVASIGRFEPLAGAWTEEYGAFCMVLAFAVLMVRRSRAMAAENIRLHLQEEVREKTQYLQELLVERGQLISELGHDMKSPLTSLSNMAQIIRLNDIMLDQDTRRRMLQIEEQCGISEENLPHIFRRSFTTRSDRGGQGLGLAITRDIILEHGGRTEVFCTHIISNILKWQSRKSSIVFPALRQEDRAESNGAKINSVSNSAKSFPILPTCLRGAGDRLQWYVEENTQFKIWKLWPRSDHLVYNIV